MNGVNVMVLVDTEFFYLIVKTSIISKIDRKNGAIKALLAYIGLFYLLDCDYPAYYEVGLTALHFIFYEDRRIPVDKMVHFNKMLDQYNKFKLG